LTLDNHHFGRIATIDPDSLTTSIDVGSLVRRLILFETCSLDSIKLREVPALVETFGVDGLLELVDSGSLRIFLDTMLIADQKVGETLATVKNGRVFASDAVTLKLVSTVLDGPGRVQVVTEGLQEVRKSRVSAKDDKKLRKALSSRLLLWPRDAGEQGLRDTDFDLLRGDPLIFDGIQMAHERLVGTPSPWIGFSTEKIEEGTFRIKLTSESDYDLSSELTQKVIVQGVLAVAGMNKTINLMSNLEAATGFRDEEARLFTLKMRSVAELLLQTSFESEFDRIVKIGGLPALTDLPAGSKIDVKQLMKIRESSECAEMRDWIKNGRFESDIDIASQFSDLHAKVSYMTQSNAGRVTRFVATTLLGNVPIAGLFLGPAASATDSFLVDHVLGQPGPAIFLSHNYPSIFS
jgi:hypothetical protein